MIIHVHYRHLLIPIHVDDCFTTSLTFGFSLPSFGLPHPPRMVCSVSTYAFSVSMRGQHDRLPLIIPPFPLLSVNLYLPLSCGTASYGCHPSHSSFIALFCSPRNCTVLYLLHACWHTRLLSTIFNRQHCYPRPPTVRSPTSLMTAIVTMSPLSFSVLGSRNYNREAGPRYLQ